MFRLVKAAATTTATKRRRGSLRLPLNNVRCLSSVTSSSGSTASTSCQIVGASDGSASSNTSSLQDSLLYHQQQQQQQLRYHSSMAAQQVIPETGSSLSDPEDNTTSSAQKKDSAEEATRKKRQRQRLERIRNVGILAHVDAGKTTVTERMLGLAGVVRNIGRVDTGNTVTDYLPAERERGITIQSAAAIFDWGWHHSHYHNNADTTSSSSTDIDSSLPQDRVHIHLIDTPGHVDFSVEVHRSVAVLDGAVLVVDAVAGVQAQTETVWKCMKESRHQPLPSIVVINKMDKEGCSFSSAMDSIRHKLPGANPLPIQVPLFRVQVPQDNCLNLPHLLAIPHDSNVDYGLGDFVGVLDLIHMRAIVYPDHKGSSSSNVEDCTPDVYPLLLGGGSSAEPTSVHDSLIDPGCPLTRTALQARHALVEQLAGDCGDELMEEYYLEDAMPSPRDLQQAIRKATLNVSAVPVVAAAALRGKGVEPLLDCIADLLPSPLDRPAPELLHLDAADHNGSSALTTRPDHLPATTTSNEVSLGHPLHEEMLAFAFKVCHLPGGRGGSGDGRVVFCRVYSGTLRERDVLHVLSAPTKGEEMLVGNNTTEVRKERVGGMLELRGGAFTNKQDGICQAGDVCALVGLKNVVTGDTLVLAKKPGMGNKKSKKSAKSSSRVCLAGVASPKPVLQVRLEAETQQEQARLSECLEVLAVEDPSLCIEETDAGTLLSGLGELHIEVTLDRLHREFGLSVHKGVPSVAYRETLLREMETPNGTLLNYDRTVGDTRLQAAVHLKLKPTLDTASNPEDVARLPTEPIVTVGPRVLEYLQLNPDASHEEYMTKSPVYKALVQGCQGALKRGPVGSYAMANVACHVEEIDADEGLSGLQALPGALRAAAMNAVSTTMSENVGQCRALEPAMDVQISAPNDMVGTVLSDLTNRRGLVEDVVTGDGDKASQYRKTLVRAQVPLVEILGYANALRSLTGGEGNFTAEYKGHAACSVPVR